jgi:hypothetical protein
VNILRFETNAPVEVALKYDVGSEVEGRFGPQVLYTLTDGRLMYLDPKVARHLNELGITAGEPFAICKRELRNGQKRTIEWEVKRLGPAPALARLELVPPGGDKEAARSAPQAAKAESGFRARPPSEQVANASDLERLEQAIYGMTDSPLETQLRDSMPGIAQLEHALKTAIAAAASAEQFGQQLGYAVCFSPDDIRAMAISVLGGGGTR